MEFYRVSDGETENDQIEFKGGQVEISEKQSEVLEYIIGNPKIIQGKLSKKSVVKEFLTTATDGKIYNVTYYNFDVAISVGYRIRSKLGTKFIIWATNLIKEYIRKGFVKNYMIEEEISALKDLVFA